MAFVTALFLLSLLTIRFAWLLSYVNYDYVNEMLVYAHASPDVKSALDQIDEISRRTVGDKMIKVAYDNDSTWPLEWYMREYPNRAYYGENPTREALDAPVVIVGSANESKVKPFLGDKYMRFSYRLVWWPIEDYKDETPARLWQTYVTGTPPANGLADTVETQIARRQEVRDNWRKLFNIIFYRDFEDYELNEWPFVHRFYVYIRRDVANEVWGYQSGPQPAFQAASLDPYEGKRTESDAVEVWGSNGTGDGQFMAPRNLAVGPDGSIYVADSGNHRIQVFDPQGNFITKWGSMGTEPGQFNEPWDVAVAQDGTVFVADTWNHRIQAFTSTGEFLNAFGSFANVQTDAQAEPGMFWGPRGLAIDAEGNLYVTDTGNKRVEKFSPEGEFLALWGGGGIVPGSFEEPVGIDIDSQGNFYVADTWNRRIQKFNANFEPLAQWDVVGWDSESVVNKPYLAVDPQGRVFISDPEGYRLIGYDSNGEVLVTWGQYGQDLASLGLPVGIEFDGDGNLLVADSDNNRIMKFQVPVIQASGG
jgi:DNA-binding beta-propeller fold protein YncE